MKYITLSCSKLNRKVHFVPEICREIKDAWSLSSFFVCGGGGGDDCITRHCSQVTDTVHLAGTRYIIVRECFLTSEEISSKRNPYIFKEKSKEINFVRKFLKNFYDYWSELLKVLNLIKIQ